MDTKYWQTELTSILRSIHPDLGWRMNGGGIEIGMRKERWLAFFPPSSLKEWDKRSLAQLMHDWFPELFERTSIMATYSPRDAEKKGLSFGVALKGVFQIRPDVSVGSAMSLGFDLADLFGMQGSDQIKAFVQGFVAGIDTTGSTAMALLEQDLRSTGD